MEGDRRAGTRQKTMEEVTLACGEAGGGVMAAGVTWVK